MWPLSPLGSLLQLNPEIAWLSNEQNQGPGANV